MTYDEQNGTGTCYRNQKIRDDQDKIQAYLKTCAEQITIIAENTAPAESEPAASAET